jgi:hypothetical protein
MPHSIGRISSFLKNFCCDNRVASGCLETRREAKMKPDRMRYCSQLNSCGWLCVHGISSQTSLLELANSIGTPVTSPSGDIVKTIKVTSAARARPGTLSAQNGQGEFPLHTDTAFWPVPARYLVLRALGDTRRCTTVRSFAELFRGHDALLSLAEKSVWLARTHLTSFYCSMLFRHRNEAAWRYDANCMLPVNLAAKQLERALRLMMSCDSGNPIAWSGSDAVVISNWNVLHGRGPSPQDEGERILERIYVR